MILGVLLTLALACTIYAILLQTKPGRWFADNLTFLATIVGVAGVLGACVFLIGVDDTLLVLAAFAAGGFPMCVRGCYNLYTEFIHALEVMKE